MRVVLARPSDKLLRAWTAIDAERAGLSSDGVHHEVEGATHASLALQREDARITGEEILRVVEAVRTGRPLTRQSTTQCSEEGARSPENPTYMDNSFLAIRRAWEERLLPTRATLQSDCCSTVRRSPAARCLASSRGHRERRMIPRGSVLPPRSRRTGRGLRGSRGGCGAGRRSSYRARSCGSRPGLRRRVSSPPSRARLFRADDLRAGVARPDPTRER
jgi:hypothetical protein